MAEEPNYFISSVILGVGWLHVSSRPKQSAGSSDGDWLLGGFRHVTYLVVGWLVGLGVSGGMDSLSFTWPPPSL